MTPDVITIDFETLPIQDRPHYPPDPVGVAIKWPGEESRYYAWGHPTGNNCTPREGFMKLVEVWDAEGLPILCHHAKFDIAVASERLGFAVPRWQDMHDTTFLAFLYNPHARSLGLKELAADMLDWPAEEQDDLRGWIVAHKRELEAAWPQYGSVTKKHAGKWIFAAPAELVGRYAIGDVERTAALFKHLWPIVQKNGMGAAYDRERRLLPILMENERVGMRVDIGALHADVPNFQLTMEFVEDWLRRELRASGLNLDADADVAAVLRERGVVPEDKWQTTKSGRLSVKKDVLTPDLFTDPRIASALGYRNRLKTCLTMFMEPWLRQAQARNGFISTNWNQVRGTGGGTRTGRPSTSNPNFLNISKDFEGRTDGYVHPDFLDVQPLPLVRKYILPDEGHVFLHRDFDGQELRIFAHFEEGELMAGYRRDPNMDAHAMVRDNVRELTGIEFERTVVKNINFGKIYGAGITRIAQLLKSSYAEAKQFNAMHDKAMPGRKILNDEIKRVLRRGDPIRTWGGRIYYEEPRGPDGRSKDYKVLNYLIQGSAADITKEALCQWYESGAPKRGARFLVTVYDEINITAQAEHTDAHMSLLRDIMNQDWLDVPMRSVGKRGSAWGALIKCE